MTRLKIELKDGRVIECNTNNERVNKEKIYQDLNDKYGIGKSQVRRIVQKVAKPVE